MHSPTEQLEQGQFSQQQSHSDNSSSEFIKTTKAGRKNLCDVCVKSLAKYTCPGCFIKSCNIQCINKHKEDHNCTGKANTTGYVEKSRIDEDLVRKDFQYVKGMLGETDKIKKTLTGVTAHVQEPKRFYFLRKQARVDHNIKVHQAPPMIERHRENISFYYMKTKTIYWVVQILYYIGNRKYSRTVLQPQPDTKTIAQLLPTTYLCQQLLLKQINTTKPQQFDIFFQNRQTIITHNSNPHTHTHPHTGQEEQDRTGGDREKMREKFEEERRENRVIVEVDRERKLVDVLKNMNVYQFPGFILVHKSMRKMFNKWKKIN